MVLELAQELVLDYTEVSSATKDKVVGKIRNDLALTYDVLKFLGEAMIQRLSITRKAIVLAIVHEIGFQVIKDNLTLIKHLADCNYGLVADCLLETEWAQHFPIKARRYATSIRLNEAQM